MELFARMKTSVSCTVTVPWRPLKYHLNPCKRRLNKVMQSDHECTAAMLDPEFRENAQWMELRLGTV